MEWLPQIQTPSNTVEFLQLIVNVVKFNATYLDEHIVHGIVKYAACYKEIFTFILNCKMGNPAHQVLIGLIYKQKCLSRTHQLFWNQDYFKKIFGNNTLILKHHLRGQISNRVSNL